MSLMGKIGAAVGIGAAQVSLTPDQSSYAWGDAVRGTVRVTGGKVEQTATEIRVSIREHWVTRDSEGDREDNYQFHNPVVLARGVTLAPESVQEWAFETRVPEDASFGCDWAVYAVAAIPHAVDPQAAVPFRLELPRAARGVIAALQAIAPFERKSATARGQVAVFDLRAQGSLHERLDRVQVELQNVGDEIQGTLHFHPHEHGFAGKLRGLLHRDVVRHEVRFPAAELAARPDGPPPAAVVAQLRELLQPFLTP